MAGSERELILSEDDAQAVALVRAVEETDRTGVLLPLADRRAATATAREAQVGRGDEAWIAARARELADTLRGRFRFLPRFLGFSSPVRGLLVPALLVAFVLGLGTNALGPEKHINVLAVPLLGLIAWNLTVLALGAVRAALPFDLTSDVPRFVGRLQAMARRLIDRLPARELNEGDRDLWRKALRRYLVGWMPAVAPLASARGRRLLHVSSLVLILGAVAGMYARGVAFQYRATWESTFLKAEAVDRFLGTILAPAATVLGRPVPSALEIKSPEDGDAAPWIHLWAVTAALFAGIPRLVMATAFGLRAARRRRRLRISVPDAYLRRLLASVDTSERRLEILPFSYRPSSQAAEALKQLLYDLFGPRSEIRLRPTLDYGIEPEAMEPGDGRLRLVLFGLAQTPEVEVHGELLRQLCDDLPDGQALLAMVDDSSYRRRLEGVGGADDRLAQRRRAWDRVVRDAGLSAVHVDLSADPDDELLNRALESAWPPGALEGGA